MDKIKEFTKMQQTEADLHWKRNGFFLLSSSILLVALGQFKEMQNVQLSFGILGLTLNLVWLLIQYRSSKYIKYWKSRVNELTQKNGWEDIYSPKVKGIQMRKLAMILPLPFLLIWAVVLFS